MSKQNALHTAGATVAAVQAYDERLAELYADGTADPLEVKALNSRIGIGLKLAEIHALIAIAEALESAPA